MQEASKGFGRKCDTILYVTYSGPIRTDFTVFASMGFGRHTNAK